MSEVHVDQFLRVRWDDMHRQSIGLARQLANKGPWQGVITVTRGGMVPACLVARELGIRLIETACVVGYEEDDQNPDHMERARVIKPAIGTGDGAGWLVIDDVADTGRTFAVLRKTMPAAHYAAVYVKPKGRPLTDTFIEEVSQETWIHFPWEVEPA